MAPAATFSQFDQAALDRRIQLQGKAGPRALLQNFKVFGIASFACLGGLLYGYNQGVFSGVLTMHAFGDHMGVYITDQTKKGWLTSILELGAWTGTLYSGFLAEIISRKYAIIVNTAIFLLGVIIQCTAIQAGHSAILGGRFVVGMGVGSLSMIVPMYVAECAPPEVRGLLVGLQQVAIEFGILISFWIVSFSLISFFTFEADFVIGLWMQLHWWNRSYTIRGCLACSTFSPMCTCSYPFGWNGVYAILSTMAHPPWS